VRADRGCSLGGLKVFNHSDRQRNIILAKHFDRRMKQIGMRKISLELMVRQTILSQLQGAHAGVQQSNLRAAPGKQHGQVAAPAAQFNGLQFVCSAELSLKAFHNARKPGTSRFAAQQFRIALCGRLAHPDSIPHVTG
jgi:hypothetical protein